MKRGEPYSRDTRGRRRERSRGWHSPKLVAMRRLLESLLLATALMGVLLLVPASTGRVAFADGGPHGGYTSTGGAGGGLPDQCAGCHRVHQGISKFRLLNAANPYALCLTCHNGSGSRLDVFDGVRLDAVEARDPAVVGVQSVPGMIFSVAPDSTRHAPAGSTVEYTIAVSNTSYAITTNYALSLSEASSADFLPSSLTAAVLSIDCCEVQYIDLVVTIAPTAPSGAQLLTSVTVTSDDEWFGPQTAIVTVQTKVGLPSAGNTLNGGGFMFVNGAQVTSRHNADPADDSSYPWGFIYPTSGQTTNTGLNANWMGTYLQCTSCHNPHGSNNYRILRDRLFGTTTPLVTVRAYYAGALTKDEGAPGLSAGAPVDKYVREYYASEGTGGAPNTGAGSLASLCVNCHVAYPSTGATVSYTGGGTTHYRHKTEMPFTDWSNPDTGRVSQNPETNPLSGFPALRLASNASNDNTIVTCLTCHRVHGTASTMNGYALRSSLGGLADDDLSPAQTTSSRSTCSLRTTAACVSPATNGV